MRYVQVFTKIHIANRIYLTEIVWERPGNWNTYILSRRTGDIDPGLGEEGAGAQHEDDVEYGVHGVVRDVRERLRRAEVVAQPAHRVRARRAAAAHVRPHAQQVH